MYAKKYNPASLKYFDQDPANGRTMATKLSQFLGWAFTTPLLPQLQLIAWGEFSNEQNLADVKDDNNILLLRKGEGFEMIDFAELEV